MNLSAQRVRARLWRNIALATLMVLLLLRIPYAAAHMDMARDVFVAWRMLRGETLPLEGPVLNGMIHLGPVWYYLLAALQFLGRTWFGTIALLGLLAALQIPLAYLLGKEMHSRRAGLLWGVGLIVPSWTTYEWMLPLHPLLTPLFVLAFLLCCLRYWRGGKRRYFYGMALTFTLAFHAHPSTVGLVWIGLFVLLRARHVRITWRDFLFAGLVALAPLLPFVYADAQRGFEDLHKSAGFAGNPAEIGSLANVLPLFVAIVYGGTHYLFDPLTGLSERTAQLAAGIVACGGIAGAVGLLFALRDRRTRALMLFALAATLAILLTVALMRGPTPYYMTTLPQVCIAGLVAIGLAALGSGAAIRTLQVFATAAAVTACLVTTYANARFEIRGAWPFAWRPMFDVKHTPDALMPLLLTPAYAMDDSGRFLCAQSAPSIHGTYGNQLIHNYGIEMRLACARADVHIGGAEAERTHWLGLSHAMFAAIGVRPEQRIGPIGLVRARPVLEQAPILEPAAPRYPAYKPDLTTPAVHRLSVPLNAGEHLVVSNIAFAFNLDPSVTVQIAGKNVPALAQDSVAGVYPCAGCEPGTATTAEVDITSGDFADIDVVVF